MGTSHHRRRRALGAAVAFCALGFMAPPMAGADEDPYAWAPAEQLSGPLPDQLFEEMGSCPRAGTFESGIVPFCIKFKVTDGRIKLGSTVARIEPFEVVIAIGTQLDEDGNTQIVAIPGTSGSGGAGGGGIPMSGGLLGLPDSLVGPGGPLEDLLGLSATPEIGSPTVVPQPGQSATLAGGTFLSWLLGDAPDQTVTLGVPLSIKLNNALFGDDCRIDEFTLNLTNGTTSRGMSGASGTFSFTDWYKNGYPPAIPFLPGPTFELFRQTGAHLVDNTFEVPAVSGCGLLGIGKALDGAGLGALNLFDMLINSQAGTPSRSGNYVDFTVDTIVASYNSGSGLASPWYLDDPRSGG